MVGDASALGPKPPGSRSGPTLMGGFDWPSPPIKCLRLPCCRAGAGPLLAHLRHSSNAGALNHSAPSIYQVRNLQWFLGATCHRYTLCALHPSRQLISSASTL